MGRSYRTGPKVVRISTCTELEILSAPQTTRSAGQKCSDSLVLEIWRTGNRLNHSEIGFRIAEVKSGENVTLKALFLSDQPKEPCRISTRLGF